MSRPGRPFRITSVVMGLLFLLSALVQLNDPDPWTWIAVYVVAGALSVAAARTELPAILPALHALIAFAWCAWLFPRALETSFGQMFGAVRMMSPAVEEGRETLGLAIIGTWMAVVAWTRHRVRRL